MKYKLVIFDFDGTLADTFPYFLSVYERLADKYRFKKVEIADIESLHAIDVGQMIRLHAVPMWKIALVARDFRAWMAKEVHHIELFEGIEPLLARLASQGVTLALVSSNSYENVRGVLGPRNAALFRYYECGVSMFGKQAKFQRILRKCGVRPEEAFSIGDEIRDIDAAHQARIACGAVTWGYTGAQALAALSPSAIFNTVDELSASL